MSNKILNLPEPKVFVVGSFVMAQCWFMSDFPQIGESLNAHYCSQEYGGKGLNVAIGAARLGASVQLALGLGQDSAAGQLKQQLLLEKNLDFQATTHEFAGLSGQGAGWVNQQGANQIVVYSGANACLGETEAKKDSAIWQNYTAIYAQFESSLGYILAIFAHAKAKKQRTILNPSPWAASNTHDMLRQKILDHTDILLVNQTEFVDFLDYLQITNIHKNIIENIIENHPKNLDAIWQKWHGKAVIVTLGAAGALVYRPNKAPLHVAGFAVQVKDTVGAGDAFAAALLAGGLGEMDIDSDVNWHEILRFGHAAGAYLTAHLGVFAILPDRVTLTNFIENSHKK